MNEKTEDQLKFTKKFKEQFGVELNWDRYYINRGRGWSRSDGTCGAFIYSVGKNAVIDCYSTCYSFNGPIKRFLPKKYHFYISYETLGRDNDPEIFLAWYDENGKIMFAINEYALFGTEPNLTGMEKSLFTLIKPQIENKE